MGRGYFFGIPFPIVITLVVLALLFVLLHKMSFGRKTFAIGGNEKASFIAGVKTNKIKIFVYSISGVLASLAGIILISRLNSAQPTVGLSVSTLSNPFFVSLEEGVNTLATENGTQVISVDAQDDSAKQSNDVDDLIQQGVDVLLINPVDSAAITPAVEAANSAGIPVIMVDRATDVGEYVTLVASDNVAGGEMAAQYIVDQVGENASTLQLEGVPGASATNERGEGFTNVAETSLNVLDSQTANFDRAEGLTVMENMLQGNSDVQAVFAQNDEIALGAIEAIQGAGLSNQITVVSFDGTEGGIKAVEDGSLAATIAQQPDEMGRLALQAAYDFYAGQEIPEKIDSPLELVTKD